MPAGLNPRRLTGCELVGGWWLPVGVLLRKEEDGVMGGVTGGVRFPLVWRGGVQTLPRDRLPARDKDSLGCTFFFRASCSRLAASVMNLVLWGTNLFRVCKLFLMKMSKLRPSHCRFATVQHMDTHLGVYDG